jgi:hypothetical protein
LQLSKFFSLSKIDTNGIEPNILKNCSDISIIIKVEYHIYGFIAWIKNIHINISIQKYHYLWGKKFMPHLMITADVSISFHALQRNEENISEANLS